MERKYIAGLSLLGLGLIALIVKKGGGWAKPVNARISSKFGPRDIGNHNGIDLAVPVGTKIVAPQSGIVDLVNYDNDGGNQIIIKHDNGYKTGYAHLTKALVKKGDRINKGQLIALSGNSGAHTTGAHLHLTLTNPQGVKVDPERIIYT